MINNFKVINGEALQELDRLIEIGVKVDAITEDERLDVTILDLLDKYFNKALTYE